MQTKTTTALLLATALPSSTLLAHSVHKHEASVNGYLFLMIAIAAVYLLFLIARVQRRKQRN